MGVIARRLQDKEEDWRHVYKSLLLLEFMAKHGPQKVGLAAYHSGFCCWSLWPSLGPGQPHLLHATDAAAGGAFGQAWSLDGACLSHSGPLEVVLPFRWGWLRSASCGLKRQPQVLLLEFWPQKVRCAASISKAQVPSVTIRDGWASPHPRVLGSRGSAQLHACLPALLSP